MDNIHWDMKQRTDEWREYKAGKIGASDMFTIMPGKRGGYTQARAHYMDRLAQEIITGEVTETFCSPEMQRGIDLEPDALTEYEMDSGNIIEAAGFIDHPKIENAGCSPDGLVTGFMTLDLIKGVEGKCLIGANHTAEIIAIKKGKGITPKYNYQIQWSMMCAEVNEWDYVLYNPDCKIPELRLFYTTIKKDEMLCSQIYAELLKFKVELTGYVNTLKEIIKEV